MSKSAYPIAVVTWLDACIHWGEQEDVIHEPKTQYSAGWLVRSDELGVSLAYTHSDDTGLDDQLFIPAGMVQSVRVIK